MMTHNTHDPMDSNCGCKTCSETKMTPEEINIAIAIRLGWKSVSLDNPNGYPKTGPCGSPPNAPDGGLENFTLIPNFYADLNAIAKAVESLSKKHKHAYAVILANMFWPLGWRDYTSTLEVSEAASEKRCEAFLKTFGDWRS